MHIWALSALIPFMAAISLYWYDWRKAKREREARLQKDHEENTQSLKEASRRNSEIRKTQQQLVEVEKLLIK